MEAGGQYFLLGPFAHWSWIMLAQVSLNIIHLVWEHFSSENYYTILGG